MIATIAARTAARFSRSVDWFYFRSARFSLSLSLCAVHSTRLRFVTSPSVTPATRPHTSDVHNILLNHRCVIENHLRSTARNTFPPFDTHSQSLSLSASHTITLHRKSFLCIFNRNGNFLFPIPSHIKSSNKWKYSMDINNVSDRLVSNVVLYWMLSFLFPDVSSNFSMKKKTKMCVYIFSFFGSFSFELYCHFWCLFTCERDIVHIQTAAVHYV